MKLKQEVREIILDEIIRLHPMDSKSNVCIPFTLKKDYGSLEFICSYEPKNCNDRERAKRLILEGLDTYVPAGYRNPERLPRQYAAPDDGLSWETFLPSVVNLVTLSIDAPGLYLGCAHRHASEQRHKISADFSSPGFFRLSPGAGDWRAVINVHAVVTSEVRYHLQVIAYNGGD